VIRFPTRSTQSNTRGLTVRGYADEADVFLVHCPQNGRTYAVPVDEAPPTGMYLRIRPPTNGQIEGIRWAKDFELPG
jgi:hypothetical protein